MAQQPKKIGAIQKAFLLQTNKNEGKTFKVSVSVPNDQSPKRNEEKIHKVSVDVPNDQPPNWMKEKNILLDKIKVVENEKKQIQAKYDNLKTKHFKLLQTLLNLEEKNRNLESKFEMTKTVREEIDTEPIDDGLAANSSPSYEIELLAELVNILLIN